MNNIKVKKVTIFTVAMLVLLSFLAPINLGFVINQNLENLEYTETENFSITLHRIRQEDEIDPWPYGEADWHLAMYVNDVKKTYDCVGDDVYVDKTFTWVDIIEEGMEFVNVRMELLDLDTWPNEDDIADISAYIDPDYEEGDYDDTTDFEAHRPAVFMRSYNVITKEWVPEDEDNDYLYFETTPPFYWCVTSGNYDGSTTVDENDATIWFNVSAGNTPPYPPEKPSGITFGWIDETYEYTTKGADPDLDLIQFGWDWNNDNVVDTITGFYDAWEPCTTPNSWDKGHIYYIKTIAIDSKGASSEWSEKLKVRINAPGGINGVEIDEWSLGHIYCIYFDHEATEEIIEIIQDGGDILAALAILIAAIANACGIPFQYEFILAIASALLNLGIEIIKFFDQGMGIYFKAYIVEIGGFPVSGFGYIWSQTEVGMEADPPIDNVAPEKPAKPSGEIQISPGKEYSFTSSTTDSNGDEIIYVFDWGDGNYSCSDLNESGIQVGMSHSWGVVGSYQIRVKSLDEWGFESSWSDPLEITVEKSRQKQRLSFFNLFSGLMTLKKLLISRIFANI